MYGIICIMYTSCCPGGMNDYNYSRCDYAPIFMWREKSIHTSHIFLNFVVFFSSLSVCKV